MKKTKGCALVTILVLLIGIVPMLQANPLPVFEVYWMDKYLVNTERTFTTDLKLDTLGSTKLAAFTVLLTYDPALIQPDTNFGQSGVEAADDGFILTAYIAEPGTLAIAGFDPEGKKDVTLFTVHWYLRNVGSDKNRIDMKIDILVDENTNDIPYTVNRKTATIMAGKLPGDVNSNNVVDITDALLTASYYVGKINPDFDPDVADVNCDGKIDIVDAMRIAQYYVQAISSLDCP